MLALLLHGALGCSHEGFSPRELVQLISTPEEHQRYINTEIVKVRDDLLLDREYTEVRPRVMPEPSGAWIETFHEFATRGAGMCWDAAISFTATLADDGYGKRVVLFSNHAIYVYQEGGLWGSGGIDASDYNPPTFESIDELVEHQMARSGEQYDGDRIVFDFSATDTLGRPASPLLRHSPFIADYRVGQTHALGATEKTDEGFVNLIQGRFSDSDVTFTQRVSYNDRLFRESEIVERRSADGTLFVLDWSVLERSAAGQQVRSREVLRVDGELVHTKDFSASYNLLAQREVELTETWRADGDREFEQVVRTEFDRDGNVEQERCTRIIGGGEEECAAQ